MPTHPVVVSSLGSEGGVSLPLSTAAPTTLYFVAGARPLNLHTLHGLSLGSVQLVTTVTEVMPGATRGSVVAVHT